MMVLHSRPARHSKAVVFNCTADHVWLACFVADQIRCAEPEPGFDVCICTFKEPHSAVIEHFADVRFVQLRRAPFEGLSFDETMPAAAYIRIAVPELFKDEYGQILYLDTDVYFRKGSVSQLFQAANPDFAVSAVLDSPQWTSGSKSGFHANYWQQLGVTGLKYLNSGVLVFNVDKYCKEEVYSQAIALAKRKKHCMVFYDQSLLNAVLRGNWHPMSLRWNWQMNQPYAPDLVRQMDPFLLHFAGTIKPFNPSRWDYATPYRSDYRKFLCRHLDIPLFPAGLRRSCAHDPGSDAMIVPWNWQNLALWARQKALLFPRKWVLNKEILHVERLIAQGQPLWPR